MDYKQNLRNEGIETRKKILNYIIAYLTEHGYSPTVREICEGAGIKSTSSIQSHLKKMITTGELETDAGIGSPRAIRVPGYKFVKVD